MNKPYTCHNCSTQFDAWPAQEAEMFETMGQSSPQKVKVKCPGCYGAGYTTVEQMIYTLDISNTPKLA